MKYANLKIISALLILCSVVSVFSGLTFTSYATSEPQDNIIDCEPDAEYLYVDSTDYYFEPNKTITISFIAKSDDRIIDMIYDSYGFEVLSYNIDQNNNNRVVFELKGASNTECSLSLNVTMTDGTTHSDSVYAICNQYGSFVSQYSNEHATYMYLDYLVNANLLTQEQREKIKNNIAQNSLTTTIEKAQEISTYAVRPTTSLHLYVTWKDNNGDVNPLRKAKVQLYKVTSSSRILLSTRYTDNDGVIDVELTNTSQMRIECTISATDGNASVIEPTSNTCYSISKDLGTVSANTRYVMTAQADMSNHAGQSFQIHQAIITAQDYAEDMINSTPEPVTINYPDSSSDGQCCYISGNNTIKIVYTDSNSTINAYEAWDIITHEYGHHIQHQVNITDSPGGDHNLTDNLAIERDNKDDGIKLAWAEAWASVFGLISQYYCNYFLMPLDHVQDPLLTSYNIEHNLNTNTVANGDACEITIASILFDLYDSDTESIDSFALGAQAWWNITATHEATTFSMFVADFYEEYYTTSHVLNFGKLLSYYNIAPNLYRTEKGTSNTDPVKIIFRPQGGHPSEYYNDRVDLIVYDDNMDEILRVSALSGSNYTLTTSQWWHIINNCESEYSISFVGYNTDSPITGPYFSECYTLSLP